MFETWPKIFERKGKTDVKTYCKAAVRQTDQQTAGQNRIQKWTCRNMVRLLVTRHQCLLMGEGKSLERDRLPSFLVTHPKLTQHRSRV